MRHGAVVLACACALSGLLLGAVQAVSAPGLADCDAKALPIENLPQADPAIPGLECRHGEILKRIEASCCARRCRRYVRGRPACDSACVRNQCGPREELGWMTDCHTYYTRYLAGYTQGLETVTRGGIVEMDAVDVDRYQDGAKQYAQQGNVLCHVARPLATLGDPEDGLLAGLRSKIAAMKKYGDGAAAYGDIRRAAGTFRKADQEILPKLDPRALAKWKANMDPLNFIPVCEGESARCGQGSAPQAGPPPESGAGPDWTSAAGAGEHVSGRDEGAGMSASAGAAPAPSTAAPSVLYGKVDPKSLEAARTLTTIDGPRPLRDPGSGGVPVVAAAAPGGAGPPAAPAAGGEGAARDPARDLSRTHVKRARESILAGRYSAGETQAAQALRLAPEDPAGHVARAYALLRLERHAEAEEAASRAVRIAPRDAVAFRVRSLARDAAGRRDEAMADLDKAARLDRRYRNARGAARAGMPIYDPEYGDEYLLSGRASRGGRSHWPAAALLMGAALAAAGSARAWRLRRPPGGAALRASLGLPSARPAEPKAPAS